MMISTNLISPILVLVCMLTSMTLRGEELEKGPQLKKAGGFFVTVAVENDDEASVIFAPVEKERTSLAPKDFMLTIITRSKLKISPTSFEGKEDQTIPLAGSRGGAGTLVFHFEKGTLSARDAEKAIVQIKGKQVEVDVNEVAKYWENYKNKNR